MQPQPVQAVLTLRSSNVACNQPRAFCRWPEPSVGHLTDGCRILPTLPAQHAERCAPTLAASVAWTFRPILVWPAIVVDREPPWHQWYVPGSFQHWTVMNELTIKDSALRIQGECNMSGRKGKMYLHIDLQVVFTHAANPMGEAKKEVKVNEVTNQKVVHHVNLYTEYSLPSAGVPSATSACACRPWRTCELRALRLVLVFLNCLFCKTHIDTYRTARTAEVAPFRDGRHLRHTRYFVGSFRFWYDGMERQHGLVN